MVREHRIQVWKQGTNSADRPWRRKYDRQFGFKYVLAPSGKQMDWAFVMSIVGRRAMTIRTRYDYHYRCRLTTVYLGTRAFLRERFAK